ncbi:PREDICTED: TRAF3-interacting protein 1 isoform X1 [Cyprinodon variegatus]|uniref:TRAF3-interacting protein 1 isoform X1 n=1 Tax=Cyprinodon variegatus TaxID=28743 RepID=UPI000742631D|nr:PREDICTED: TRAF3-interacting protein 1 isoform X1 [Cyprinodon variegatus]
MNAAVVKKTQDTLGKVIKKPPLTEKLLSRPPFRYLHDIFSEVIRTTGFMKGLYEEKEMKSDNVKDKDSKIAFLQKAIDVVMLVSGEPLAAKPARIIAGHEPERTNELLQALAKCCLNKLSSDEAVKRVLSGEKVDLKTKTSSSRSQGKEKREGRERQPDKEEKKKIERSGSREQKDPKQPKDQESRHRDKEDQRDHERAERHHRSEQEHQTKDRDKDKERERDKDRDKGRVRDKEKGRELDRDKEKTRERDSHRDKGKDRNEKNRSGDRGNVKARESEEPQQKPPPEEQSTKTAKPMPADLKGVEELTDVVENQSGSPARIPRPSSAKGQRRKPKAGHDESDSEGDGELPLAQRHVPQENGDANAVPSSDQTSGRTARPSSARPAPPRVRRQTSSAEGTPAERLSSAKPPALIIMDGKRMSEEEDGEDEQFLVVEAAPPDAPEMEREPAPELDTDEKHGGLVKKILETKKDYEASPSSLKSKEQSSASETASYKERELVTREIERLRSSIQMVCRSSLPLGKIMDYIQEDVDAMQAELQSWRRENEEHAQALLQEQRETDRAVEPLKAELAELEQLIKDHQDKICAVKSNILKKEETIQKMLTGINFSSRT